MNDPKKKRYIYLMLAGFGAISLSIVLFFALFRLQGIGKLVEGMDVDEVIKRIEGIHCGMKPTSCPDQLATALKEAKEKL